MASWPPHGERKTWDATLLTWMEVAHNDDGTLKSPRFNRWDAAHWGISTSGSSAANAAALTQAISDVVAAGGGAIVFGPGDYQMDRVNITQGFVALMGDDTTNGSGGQPGATLVGQNNNPPICIAASNVRLVGLAIVNGPLVIDATVSGGQTVTDIILERISTWSASPAFQIRSILERFSARDCFFQSPTGHGLHLFRNNSIGNQSVAQMLFDRCRFSAALTSVNSAADGVSIDDGVNLSGVAFIQCYWTLWGRHAVHGSDMAFSQVSFINCSNDSIVVGQTSNPVWYLNAIGGSTQNLSFFGTSISNPAGGAGDVMVVGGGSQSLVAIVGCFSGGSATIKDSNSIVQLIGCDAGLTKHV